MRPFIEGTGLDGIRSACAEVAATGRFVTVDPEGVERLADQLAGEGVPEPDGSELRLPDAHDTVAFVLTWDAVNFGSGWFPMVRKRPGLSGSRTMLAELRDHVLAHGPWTPEQLVDLATDDCAAVFQQDVAELMALFADALNQLGRHLLDGHGGSFTALVRAAGGSADALVADLDGMRFFHDVAEHQGRPVPLYKRAQIVAADLHLAFDGDGFGRFDDVDRLTMFPDNLVPHVLRVDDALRYDETLAARIDAGDLLAPGSAEEVEIRACGVDAVERLVAALAARGLVTNAMTVDRLLWHRGQGPRYKAVPRHRCHTVFY